MSPRAEAPQHMKEDLEGPKQRGMHGRDEKGPDFSHTSVKVSLTKGCPLLYPC